jgi:hypothetical protein
MLDEDIIKKLRMFQAAQIRKSEKTASLLQVINETLQKDLK